MMQAIVLTFDKQIGFAELLYKKYMELWPECPFNFRIAYNNNNNIPDSLKGKENVETIKTPSDIRSTMAGLLTDIDDDDWVYWCIDDRYPTFIDTDSMQSVYEFVQSGASAELNSVKLLNWHEQRLTSKSTLKIKDKIFNFQVWRTRGHFWGFWHHRFIKAKTLKYIFLGNLLPEKYKIVDVQTIHSLKDAVIRSAQENIIYPADDFIIKLGEPCVRGTLTLNGVEDLKKYNCLIPNYRVMNYAKTFINKTTPAKKYPSGY